MLSEVSVWEEIFLAFVFSWNCNASLNKCGLNVFPEFRWKLLDPRELFLSIVDEVADRKMKMKTHFSLVMKTLGTTSKLPCNSWVMTEEMSDESARSVSSAEKSCGDFFRSSTILWGQRQLVGNGGVRMHSAYLGVSFIQETYLHRENLLLLIGGW